MLQVGKLEGSRKCKANKIIRTLAVLYTSCLQSGRILTDQAGNKYWVPSYSKVVLKELFALLKKQPDTVSLYEYLVAYNQNSMS